jgi:two-component system, cell cycle sensor histidine kinase and response regulator CckA
MTLPSNLSANRASRRRTILLVEDEPFVRDATCSILQHAGFDVQTAEDASEALDIFEKWRYAIALVMTDMVLPGATGAQLGEELRRQSPELVVLVTSGYWNPEYTIESPESHTYFLPKPYSRRSLLEKVEAILATTPMKQAATQAG